jgi:hypothetical protein
VERPVLLVDHGAEALLDKHPPHLFHAAVNVVHLDHDLADLWPVALRNAEQDVELGALNIDLQQVDLRQPLRFDHGGKRPEARLHASALQPFAECKPEDGQRETGPHQRASLGPGQHGQ